MLFRSNGARVGIVDSDGKTALTYFIPDQSEEQQKTQIQVIDLLVSKGAKLDHVDNNGNTFLFHAIDQNNLLLVQYAIQNGFDVNQPINKTITPLMYAIQKKNWDIIKFLIENGADVIQCDQNRNIEEETMAKVMSSNIVIQMMEQRK